MWIGLAGLASATASQVLDPEFFPSLPNPPAVAPPPSIAIPEPSGLTPQELLDCIGLGPDFDPFFPCPDFYRDFGGTGFGPPDRIEEWVGEPDVLLTTTPNKVLKQSVVENRVSGPRPWPCGSEPSPITRTITHTVTKNSQVIVQGSLNVGGKYSASLEAKGGIELFAELAAKVGLEATAQVGVGGSLTWSKTTTESEATTLTVNPCWKTTITTSADELKAEGRIPYGARIVWVTACAGQPYVLSAPCANELKFGRSQNYVADKAAVLQDPIQDDCYCQARTE